MKTLLSLALVLVGTTIPASAITVNMPVSGAQLASPFTVIASTSTCGGVPAVSMGYSIDSGQAVIEPTAFSASVTATPGSHILHVKCWGHQTNDQVLLPITVVSSTPTDITVASPASGATLTAPFTVAARATTCGGVPAVSMGYSIDSGQAIIEPTAFSASVTATPGSHILHVKCWGHQTNDQVLLPVTVLSSPSDISIASPANGATLTSPFLLAASVRTCASSPAISMGYSIDGGHTMIEPTSFSTSITANPGPHVLAVKCSGQSGTDQTSLNIRVVLPPAAATPVFSVPSGQYTSKQTVGLSDATAGSTIYYTLDGSAPSTASLMYSGPIVVTSNLTIEAIAVASGYSTSGMARADYSIVAPKGPSIPSNAIKQTDIQLLSGWRMKHDPGTPGISTGAMTLISDPSLSGHAQEFYTTFTDSGGELYSLDYATDAAAKNFVYDAQVWIADGSQIANLEMDNNQVMPNGDTVIYAFQCSGYSNTWEFSANVGTRTAPVVKWMRSTSPCNPATWEKNAWHHVQISYSRDDIGNITYHSVWLDGVEYDINQTVFGAFTLGWAPGVLVTNFQVDGLGSGTATLDLDNLTIYRW